MFRVDKLVTVSLSDATLLLLHELVHSNSPKIALRFDSRQQNCSNEIVSTGRPTFDSCLISLALFLWPFRSVVLTFILN